MEAVIFDMDGVLVDTEMLNVEVLEMFLQDRFGRQVERSVSFPLVGATGDRFWNPVKEALGIDVATSQIDAEMESYLTGLKLSYLPYRFEGTAGVLRSVKDKGYKIALATSSERERAEDILEQCGLGGFDVMMTGDMFVERKPNPEIYLTAAKHLGIAPERCIAVEDSSYGIEAATRAGMTVIARRETRFGIDQSLAKFMINDISELTEILGKIA